MRVSTAHVRDEFELLRCMLVGMAVRPPGSVTKRIYGAVIAFHPTIDELSICTIANSGFGYTVLFGVLNKSQPKS